jgi:hypothetical protein
MAFAMPHDVRKRGSTTVGTFKSMKSKLAFRAASLAIASLVAAFQAAEAQPEEYEFQLIENEIKGGADAVVAVRLIDKKTGAPVENAVVFATRVDMAPDGMETMTTPVEVLPSEHPGVYRFKTNLVMAGGWRFSIAAKVQGETDTVQSQLELKAVP